MFANVTRWRAASNLLDWRWPGHDRRARKVPNVPSVPAAAAARAGRVFPGSRRDLVVVFAWLVDPFASGESPVQILVSILFLPYLLSLDRALQLFCSLLLPLSPSEKHTSPGPPYYLWGPRHCVSFVTVQPGDRRNHLLTIKDRHEQSGVMPPARDAGTSSSPRRGRPKLDQSFMAEKVLRGWPVCANVTREGSAPPHQL